MSLDEFDTIRAKYPHLNAEFEVVNKIIAGGGKGALISPEVIAYAQGLELDQVTFVVERLLEGGILSKRISHICRCGNPLSEDELADLKECPWCDRDLAEFPPRTELRYEYVGTAPATPALVRIAEARADRARIAVITALPKEAAAFNAMVDDVCTVTRATAGRVRVYDVATSPALGGQHVIIHTCLGDMGNNVAATRAAVVLQQFPHIRYVIMLGIAGGIPYPTKSEEHVRLGDVVVSDRYGVVQYDFVKWERNEIRVRSRPNPPAAQLLEAVTRVRTEEAKGVRPWVKELASREAPTGYERPSVTTDILFDSEDPNKIISHPSDPQRDPDYPRVFYGAIASSNALLKNPLVRDKLRDTYGVKAVEMETSGIADATWDSDSGYLAIRGICDYCNEAKSDAWQNYASLMAAAYLRALLRHLPPLS